MPVAFDAFSNVAAGTGDLSWTHTPVGTPRAVRVDIVENSGANGVSSVTYGGVAMELVAANVHTGGEAGTVITYFLGKNIPAGAQTVAVTVSDAVAKRATAITLTAATDTCWIVANISIGSDSLANPSSTLNLLGKTCFVSLAAHSGQNAVTGITPTTGWTSRLEHDFGNQTAAWYTYNTVSTSDVACGWTQTADDAVMVALAITEAPLAIDTLAIRLIDTASVAVIFDSRALPILITESATVAVVAFIGAADSCAVISDELEQLRNQTLIVSDSCAIPGDEAQVIAQLISAEDSLVVQLSEVGTESDASGSTAIVAAIDTVEIGVSAESLIAGTLVVLDSLAAQLVEDVPFFLAEESLSVGLSESRPSITTEGGELVVAATEVCAVGAIEVITDVFVFIPGAVQNFVVADNLKVQLNGELAPPMQILTSESLFTGFGELTIQDVQLAVIESMSVVGTDVTASVYQVLATFATSDSSAIGVEESAQVVAVTILTASDSLHVDVPEDVPNVVTALTITDSLCVTATEPSDQSTQFSVLESVAVQTASEALTLSGLLTFSATDSLTVTLLSETSAFGVTTVKAVEGLNAGLSDTLTNSAAVVAVDTLAVRESEAVSLFNAYALNDSLTVGMGDNAAPIFSAFVGIATSDSCAVLAQESVTELVSFLNQLAALEDLAAQFDDAIVTQSVSVFASDDLAVQLGTSALISWQPTVTDALAVRVTDVGIAIPSVPVSVTTFASDNGPGFTDTASIVIDYEALLHAVSDDCQVQGADDDTLQPGYFSEEPCAVGVSESVATAVVPNATHDTWNGNTSVDHRHERPRLTRYRLVEKWNW